MPTRHQKRNVRVGWGAGVSRGFEEDRSKVPNQVIHSDYGLGEGIGHRLAQLEPHEQRAHQPRPAGRGDPISGVTLASPKARRTTLTTVARCWRDATSGTTPPYSACTNTCDAITFERMTLPSSTTAAAVSSHEVSMPRINTQARIHWDY
jgi:hypothetical protein